jgi:hypothetical protein
MGPLPVRIPDIPEDQSMEHHVNQDQHKDRNQIGPTLAQDIAESGCTGPTTSNRLTHGLR